ncbi:gram-negative bacteria-binding protein 3-like [Neodiprion fabricii]|uniref:gram-negative bacteria-binding protein 3-like n=1 Tax=Neodiprion fabricii TaxID=2872261 RepID=UPI001ED91AE1|nr:gram-negative bacteria-binding protein 3-like [Neodiprion fabricii]
MPEVIITSDQPSRSDLCTRDKLSTLCSTNYESARARLSIPAAHHLSSTIQPITMGTKGFALMVVLVTDIIVNVDSYDTPTPLVEVLNPYGFRVSIPDSPGVQLFAFHGNINQEMEGNEAGTFSVDIVSKKNGRWSHTNPTASLNPGDTLYFWTHVRVNGIGYEKFHQEFHVPAKPSQNTGDSNNGQPQPGDEDVYIFSM